MRGKAVVDVGAGEVDEDVDPTEPLGDPGDELLDLDVVADVDRLEEDTLALRAIEAITR